MAGKVYGYARVSTREQNLDRQLDALAAFGVDEVFADHASGKSFDRPAWLRLMGALRAGDTLTIAGSDFALYPVSLEERMENIERRKKKSRPVSPWFSMCPHPNTVSLFPGCGNGL